MNPIKTKHLRNFINPIFFFLLTLLIGLSFAFDMAFYVAVKENFTKIYPAVLSIAIIFGVLFVLLNKQKINDLIEKDNADDALARARCNDFPSTYPGLNKIPIIRLIAKIMYREGWGYSIALILIITLSIIIFSHDLGELDLQGDEYLMASAAEGYLHTGTFFKWDYLNNSLSKTRYDRAWPHSWMIAQSYKLFGVSEWSSRIISVLFGIFFIIIFYFISVFFLKNRLVGLLTVFCIMLHPSYIHIFRYTRMYAVLIPIFILLFLFTYRFITEEDKYGLSKFSSFVNHHLNFNYLFLLISLPLLLLGYHIHFNSLVIFPITFIFVIFLALYLEDRKYVILAGAGTFAVGAILIADKIIDFGILRRIDKLFGFYERLNIPYIDYMTEYPFNNMLGIILLVAGFVLISIVDKKEVKSKMIFLYIAIGFTLYFFIFMADRYTKFKYISHIIPIAIMLIVYVIILFSRIPERKSITIIFTILIASGVWNCSNNFEKRFAKLYPEYARTKFLYPEYSYPSLAYQTLIDAYDPQNEIIIANYLRGYYLRDIGHTIRHIGMLSYRAYEFKTFWKDINTYGQGWVIFEYEKRFHIDQKIMAYANTFLKKYHGKGVDATNIEMFYFNKDIIESSIYEINKRTQ
jgi:hypothetical protein